MRITFLGTGTSHGVPVINCSCVTCKSSDSYNQRLRSSILLKKNNDRLLIDCSKDFREQALRYSIKNITDILITHTHADHIFGIDELRVYNKLNDKALKIYLEDSADNEIRKLFPYLYGTRIQDGGGITCLENQVIRANQWFGISSFRVMPIRIMHGKLPILGYRIDDLAYLTDCSCIPEDSFTQLKGVETLIIGGLRRRSHATHFSLDQAIEASKKISPRQTYITHISHDLEHKKTNKELPKNIELAYDGLIIEV